MSREKVSSKKQKIQFLGSSEKLGDDLFHYIPSSPSEASYLGEDVYSSDQYSEILDNTICYHPKCSFAYNLTPGNLKKPTIIAESIPIPTYQRLAKLWGLDPRITPRKSGNECRVRDHTEDDERLERYLKNVERDLGIRSEVSEDLQLEAESNIEPEKVGVRFPESKENPYLKFIRKDGEYEKKREAKRQLRKKAKRITNQIIQTFLDWYQTLGGDDGETLLDESTLSELFQIGFDLPEAKALVIRIKELPTVPECLATLRNEPKHATRYSLRQILKQDIQREKKPTKMFAFGSMLPKENPPLRYKPPRNFVRETWFECSRVRKDLDTMKTIWVGLERLRSTIAFANWLKEHPHIKPPGYLHEKGLLGINYEEWNQIYKGFEIELDSHDAVSFDEKTTKDTEKMTSDMGVSPSSIDKSDSFTSY